MQYALKELAKPYVGATIAIISNSPLLYREYRLHNIMSADFKMRSFEHLQIPIWTVNGGWFYHPQSVLGFNMDDVTVNEWWDIKEQEWIQNRLIATKLPVMTSKVYPEYPMLVRYPIEEVQNYFGFDYFLESLNYMTALAIMWGVEEIQYYGADYTDQFYAPEERASNEFWLGVAMTHGVKIVLEETSNLMKGVKRTGMLPGFYGYKDDAKIKPIRRKVWEDERNIQRQNRVLPQRLGGEKEQEILTHYQQHLAAGLPYGQS